MALSCDGNNPAQGHLGRRTTMALRLVAPCGQRRHHRGLRHRNPRPRCTPTLQAWHNDTECEMWWPDIIKSTEWLCHVTQTTTLQGHLGRRSTRASCGQHRHHQGLRYRTPRAGCMPTLQVRQICLTSVLWYPSIPIIQNGSSCVGPMQVPLRQWPQNH